MEKIEVITYGKDNGLGNMVGVQPFMKAADYSSEDSFCRKLERYLLEAQSSGLINEKTIIVFPEYIGTWLVLSDMPEEVYLARDLRSAMKLVIKNNLRNFSKNFIYSLNVKKSIFKMRSDDMAQIYQNVFSRLAKKYKVTMIAGSIVLPEPFVEKRSLKIIKGSLFNISVVYDPRGKVLGKVIKKVFLTKEEKTFLSEGSIEELPVFETDAGRLGVAICADSWYPQIYKKFSEDNVEILAVPSYVFGDGAWKKRWKGYDGAGNPEDVLDDDLGVIDEQKAWLKYAMAGRSEAAGINNALNVFLRLDVCGLGSDGSNIAVSNGKLFRSKAKTHLITNIWL